MVGQRCQASKLKSSELKLIIYRDGLPLKLLTTHSAHIRPRHFDPTEIQFGGGYPEALRPHRSLLTKTWKFPLRYKYRSPIARSIEIYPLEPGSYEIAVTSNSNDDDPPNVIGKSQMKVTCNE